MRRTSSQLSRIAFLAFLFSPGILSAQCKDADPSARFDGSATSSQAGKLNISLNLVCEKGAYVGTLNTPLGVYVIVFGLLRG